MAAKTTPAEARSPLSRERVLAAAVELADANGIDVDHHAQGRRGAGRRGDVALQPRRQQERPARRHGRRGVLRDRAALGRRRRVAGGHARALRVGPSGAGPPSVGGRADGLPQLPRARQPRPPRRRAGGAHRGRTVTPPGGARLRRARQLHLRLRPAGGHHPGGGARADRRPGDRDPRRSTPPRPTPTWRPSRPATCCRATTTSPTSSTGASTWCSTASSGPWPRSGRPADAGERSHRVDSLPPAGGAARRHQGEDRCSRRHDDMLCHQFPRPFENVSQSDPNWVERIHFPVVSTDAQHDHRRGLRLLPEPRRHGRLRRRRPGHRRALLPRQPGAAAPHRRGVRRPAAVGGAGGAEDHPVHARAQRGRHRVGPALRDGVPGVGRGVPRALARRPQDRGADPLLPDGWRDRLARDRRRARGGHARDLPGEPRPVVGRAPAARARPDDEGPRPGGRRPLHVRVHPVRRVGGAAPPHRRHRRQPHVPLRRAPLARPHRDAARPWSTTR